MTDSTFKTLLILLAAGFAVAFCVVVLPPALASNPGLIGGFMAGFVNPYASGYALDAIMCWCVLATWVIYEAQNRGIRHGWIAVLLGVMPGVATGFAVYLLLRMRQESRGSV